MSEHTIKAAYKKRSELKTVARYLIIRLPREFREFVGSKAEIYQTTPSLACLD